MIGEKFFINIDCLSPLELNSCIRLSSNSFFNKRKEVLNTLELFKKNKKKFLSLLSDEKKLFSILFASEKEFSRKILIDHFHYCQLFFEEFIIQLTIQNDKKKRLEILQDFYMANDNKKDAVIINKKLCKILEGKKLNPENYLDSYRNNLAKFKILVNKFDNSVFDNVELALKDLDKYYFIMKLTLFEELKSVQIHRSKQYKVLMVDEVKDMIAKCPDLSQLLYFKIIALTSDLYSGNFDIKEYFKLKKLVVDNIDIFDFETKKGLVIDLSNYVSILYSKINDNDILKEILVLNNIKIENKLNLVKGKLPKLEFTQIIRVALFLKEFDWINNFLDKFENHIEKKSILKLSKAEIAYEMNDIDEVLDIINNLKFKDYSENVLLKMLYAKCCFDRKEYDLLENHLNAFESFLRRKKGVNKDINDGNIRLVLFLKRLYSNIYDKEKLVRLNADIELDKMIPHRNWLISRVEKLI